MSAPRTPGSKAPRSSSARPASRPAPPGFAARRVAVRVIAEVLERSRPFDEAWEAALTRAGAALEARDRAFSRLIALTVIRRHGELAAVLKTFLTKPLPSRCGELWSILLAGSAQLLTLDTPAHAAISMAVDQCRADPHARHFAGLTNAVLRRVATEGLAIMTSLDAASLNVPTWMLERWRGHYGSPRAMEIARCSLREAPLDITVKSHVPEWAGRLSGQALPTGSVRLVSPGRVEDLPGFAEGAWWVQDAAAALPARLLGDVAGQEIADLCAAPGGKTAELVQAGARVTAVERSPERMSRLLQNLERLGLTATPVVADAETWRPGRTFDGLLLDAPCSATGTIRRHPDILHVKRASDIRQLADLQSRLLDHAANLVGPGALVVYCTCSLEPEEGEEQIARFLARTPSFERMPITAGECGIDADWITSAGDLRTLPVHLPSANPAYSGLDGFFASRLRRRR